MIRYRRSLHQSRALEYAELMLFIDNDQSEPGKRVGIVEQSVGTNNGVGFSFEREEGFFFSNAGPQRDLDAQGLQPFRQPSIVLFGKHLRRRHESCLEPSFDDRQHRSQDRKSTRLNSS